MKKVLALCIAVTLVLIPITASSVSAPWGSYNGYPVVKVTVDGTEVPLDVPAHVSEGRTLVPVRFITEAMGATVDWDQEKHLVSIKSAFATANKEIAELRAELVRLDTIVNELLASQQSPASVASKVKPSVVGIIATKLMPDGEEMIDQGTGVVLTTEGIIVTNTHVVKQQELETTEIYVILNDGRALRAELWNYDYLSDVAVVKVSAPNLIAAELGDSDTLEVGQQILAVGNPLSLGLRNTVTAGVVSGLNRADQSAYPLIQTDAAINGGNSGGPLVDYNGKVIAITSSKIYAPGVEGLGFAIPINLVSDIIKRFNARGIVRPLLGVVIEESYFAGLSIPGAQGLTVVEIAPLGPADNAGFKVQDSLVAINKKPISTLIELRSELESYSPGARIPFTIVRGSQQYTLTVVLGERATEDSSPFEFGTLYPWEAEF